MSIEVSCGSSETMRAEPVLRSLCSFIPPGSSVFRSADKRITRTEAERSQTSTNFQCPGRDFDLNVMRVRSLQSEGFMEFASGVEQRANRPEDPRELQIASGIQRSLFSRSNSLHFPRQNDAVARYVSLGPELRFPSSFCVS